MPRSIALSLPLLLAVGCGDRTPAGGAAGAATSQEGVAKEASVSTRLGDEAAAFLWFNSRVIADAGHSLYGRFVHDQILPKLAPAAQRDEATWFITFDGDCMTEASFLKGYFRPQDAELLDEADRIGASLCYVIAVLGQGTKSWEAIDGQLRSDRVLGYMGMTVPRELDRATLLRSRAIMALVVATRIDGARFKRISYGYHSDDELKSLGFEPYEEK